MKQKRKFSNKFIYISLNDLWEESQNNTMGKWLNTWCWKTGYPYARVTMATYSTHKNQYKIDLKLKYRPETVKFLEKNTGKGLKHWVGKWFLGLDIKSIDNKRKIRQVELH